MSNNMDCATYREKAEKNYYDSKNNFDKMKLESEEMLMDIIPSDVASVTLSNKRAYFRGKYLGNAQGKNEAVNLDTIEDVRITNRTRRAKGLSIKLCLLIIICTFIPFFVVQGKYKSAAEEADSLNRKYDRMAETEPNGPLGNGYTVTDVLNYFADKEDGDYVRDEYLEGRLERANEHKEALASVGAKLGDAEMLVTKFQVAKVFCIITIIVVCIVMIVNFFKSLEKYRVLEFYCPGRRILGIEICDNSVCEKAKNIILVAKSAAQQKANMSMAYQLPQGMYNDKIGRLKEVSMLYEQGMISEAEFNRLKAEIINN